ncbi:MAG: hypothetical protein JWN66_2183 [Sphingomonas bacterium]|uniref:ChbG/HpnK family deacetylase n=1 Tax=Sphingomonas bacterium TaxID=1895847 RepID=UPI00263432A8|nr:ChbG/HpnK family deacetylase [Sphingomonas bacterium]MDB5705067.1 hypothetical protein [Sphingomonas bacterium]
MPRLVLCADDFGLSPEISQVIAGLAEDGKINAISCMTACPGWIEDSELLLSLPLSIEIGLHITLTGETPLTAMPSFTRDGRLPEIDRVMRDARFRRLPLDEIQGEIAAQFESFATMLGRPPAFVDGHQHVHVLPGIRDIVIAETARNAPFAWLRNCADSVASIAARPFRAKAIGNAYHSLGLKRAAARAGLSCNDSFGGHYDFDSDYKEIFPSFLKRPGSAHLVMCHPGAGEMPGDRIAAGRMREAAALQAISMHDMAASHGLDFWY